MAISLTDGGLSSQEVTATYSGDVVENSTTYSVQNATLPIGIPAKLTIKCGPNSNLSKVVFSGICFVPTSVFSSEVLDKNSNTTYVMSSNSMPCSNTYKPRSHFFFGAAVTDYVIRIY